MKKKEYATSRGERVSVGFFAFGAILSYYVIYSYLQLFLTDFVGVSASAVAVVFMIAKIFDAVNDPVFGVIVDMAKPKSGKYLPWLKVAAMAIPITTLIVFWNPVSQSFPMWAKTLWALISYVLWDLAYTMYDAPLSSLITVTSKGMYERNFLMALTSFMVYMGGLLVVVIVPILYPMFGWGVTGTVLGVLCFLSMIAMPFKVKERYAAETEQEATLKEMISCVVGNKFLLIVVLSMIVGSLTDVSTTLQTYFAIYCLGGSEWLTPIALATTLPVLAVVLFVPKLLTKVDKFWAYIVSRIITVMITIVIYFVGYENVPVMVSLVALRAVVSSLWGSIGMLFIADCVEYGQYKTGMRNQGIAFSLKAFVNKVVVAIAGAVGMLSLSLVGYVEGGVAQSAETIRGIWALYALGPAIGAVVAVAIMIACYKLRDKDIDLMARCNKGEITREECERQLGGRF